MRSWGITGKSGKQRAKEKQALVKSAMELGDTCDDDTSLMTSSTQSRKRRTTKCGCKWQVSFGFSTSKNRWHVTSAKLQHTNGCRPSWSQLRFVRRARGVTLSTAFLDSFKVLERVETGVIRCVTRVGVRLVCAHALLVFVLACSCRLKAAESFFIIIIDLTQMKQ